MIPQNGQNGNGTAVADMVPEAAGNVPEAPTPTGQTIDLATRTRQRARQQFQQNKFVMIGAGALVIALLLFVALSVPHRDRVHQPRGTVVGQQGPDSDQAVGVFKYGAAVTKHPEWNVSFGIAFP